MNHQGTLRIKGSKEFRHHDAIENGTWNEKLRLILPVKNRAQLDPIWWCMPRRKGCPHRSKVPKVPSRYATAIHVTLVQINFILSEDQRLTQQITPKMLTRILRQVAVTFDPMQPPVTNGNIFPSGWSNVKLSVPRQYDWKLIVHLLKAENFWEIFCFAARPAGTLICSKDVPTSSRGWLWPQAQFKLK